MNGLMGFKEYMVESSIQPSAKYVSLVYDDETQKKLCEWAIDNGFNLSVKYDGSNQDPKDFSFHTTIMYTKSVHKMPDYRSSVGAKIAVDVVGFDMLGVEHNVPVLKVQSSELNDIRGHFERTHGMEDVWPTYKPHVSLSYAKESVARPASLPSFKLIGSYIKVMNAD